MNEKYLPLGTVVEINNAKALIMITGFKINKLDLDGNIDDEEYDYSGCIYPIGVTSPAENAIFNHSDIKNVVFLGYHNEMYDRFKEELQENPKNINIDYIISGEKSDATDNNEEIVEGNSDSNASDSQNSDFNFMGSGN